MRVRISYGIDIEEIPEQVENLGFSAESSIREALGMLEKAMGLLGESDSNFDMAVSILDKARKNLTKADSIISDSQSILNGLSQHYEGGKNVSEG